MAEQRDLPTDTDSSRTPTAVVVVNYGSNQLLASALRPFMGGEAGVHVVVVDNFHSWEERKAVRRLSAEHAWDVVELDVNRGFGAGLNAGARRALARGARVLLVLNPDATISGAAARELFSRCAADPRNVLSPRILRLDGSTWFDGGVIVPESGLRAGAQDATSAIPWLSGACLTVHADMWTRLGGFDEDYFMYWEDVDLSYRIGRLGGRLLVRHDITATHAVGATQASDGVGKSNLYYRYNCRNRLLFAAKNLPSEQVRLAMRETPRFAKDVLLRGGRRQFLRHPVGPVWSVTRGSLEGYAAALKRLRSDARRQGARAEA